MRTNPVSGCRADEVRRSRRIGGARAAVALAALCFGFSTGFAQTQGKDGGRRPGGGDNSGERRGPSPQEIQSRILTSLRDRFGVTDDEEWTIISERLLKLFELRRTAGGEGGGFRGPGGGDGFRGPGGGGAAAAAAAAKGRGGFRPGGGSPEMQALQTAVNDKLPEAELKLRLTRLREVRQLNESKLHKAQEDLRAVLTVRQEAIAVLLGFLP